MGLFLCMSTISGAVQGSPVYTLFIVNRRAATSKGKASSSYNLSVSLLLDTSPSRGGLGNPVQFVHLTAAVSHTTKPKRGGTPEAPLLGELAKPLGFD